MTAGFPSMTVGIDARDLTKLYQQLRNLDSAVAKRLLVDLKAAVRPVAEQAAAEASFSTTIPSSIRVVASGGTKGRVKIAVRAGGKTAPHARVMEVGSKGNKGEIRHPVFGNPQVWVDQPSHPFLIPALQANLPKIAAAVEATIAAAIKANGLG